jgi:hypothetical protein
MFTESDINVVVVPTQIFAPEIDPIFTPELKRYTFESLSRRGVEFDWKFFFRTWSMLV